VRRRSLLTYSAELLSTCCVVNVQGSYAAMGQMGQPPAVADQYYYASYLPFQAADASAGAWPTGRDAAMSYSAYAAPMTTDWTAQSMFGRYDYSWFPGFDYGAWSANAMAVPQNAAPQKGGRTDYVDPVGGAYYEMDSANSVGINGSGVGGIEQGMKGMRVSSEEDAGASVGGGYAAPMRPSQPMPAPAKKSWANIASQPARAVGRSKIVPRAPVNLAKSDSGSSSSWESKTGPGQARGPPPASSSYSASAGGSSSSRTVTGSTEAATVPAGGSWSSESTGGRSAQPQYNPKDFDLNPKGARFFVIKSFSEDDIHRSIKYGIWCSTEYGNKRLDAAYREREGKGPVYLYFSVNGSGHFCGVAQMTSLIDYSVSANVWAQDKWKGQFKVRWIYVKDVPNSQLRHIKLENNEGKPVTNSRDTQEVPPEKGKQVLRVIHQYRHTTSIFDDFQHYEKQQQEEGKKVTAF